MATALACGLAFWIGYSRQPLPKPWMLLGLTVTLLGGFLDLFALWPETAGSQMGYGNDVVASFFENRHAFAAIVLVGLFLTFYWIEKTASPRTESLSKTNGESPAVLKNKTAPEPPPSPKQLALWGFSLCLLVSLTLSDSRSGQGAFFLLFIPLLFLSVRLDFREPHPERLVWVASATLCAGLVWIHLPDRQLHAVVRVFTENPIEVMQHREAAKGLFTQKPWLGHGSGSYPWAARSLLPAMTSGSESLVSGDSLWHALEPGFDAAETQIDMAASAHILADADSHILQLLAENGFTGLALETMALGLALFGLLRHALKTGHAGSRYAAMALSALALHGLFSPALESPVVRALYFGLMGYGAAQWNGFRLTVPGLMWGLRALCLGLLVYIGLEFHRRQQADVYFEKALTHVENPKGFTDDLAKSLSYAPNHVESNYAYAQVLVRFGRLVEALQRIDLLAEHAPDPPRQDLSRATLFFAAGRTTEATHILRTWLHRQHPPLPALEMVAGIYRDTRNCESLQRLMADSVRLRAAFPQPQAALFTVSRMQADFETGEEVNFLQRWFGGRALRERYMQRRRESYQKALEARARIEKVLSTPCLETGPSSDHPSRIYHRIQNG
jgi:tetratricopeptide (TPR) repeat protein